MGFEVLIPLLAIFSVLLVPILGVTVILTTRFALKPLAETIAAALRDSGHGSFGPSPQRLEELTEEVSALREEVHRLREVHEFDRTLLEGKTGSD
ncbi:MAG: hypothetical protein PVJ76_20715 [Gemmatimonadota bacterium]|jgi:hypothetical protein